MTRRKEGGAGRSFDYWHRKLENGREAPGWACREVLGVDGNPCVEEVVRALHQGLHRYERAKEGPLSLDEYATGLILAAAIVVRGIAHS